MVTRARIAIGASCAVAFGILVVAPACGSGFLDGLSGGSRDAGNEAAPPVDTGADARACTLNGLPPRPRPETDTSSRPTVIVALDAIRIDNSETQPGIIAPTVGLDLDNACTCPEPESCTPPPDAGPKKCDGDGGADNALGKMFASLGGIDPKAFGPDFATKKIREGSYGALMSIADWNHEPNDAKVFVAFFLSQGAEAQLDGGGGAIAMDGSDVWTLDPASILNGDANIGVDCTAQPASCVPQYVTEGYVVDNTVVAKLNVPFGISASSGQLSIKMEDVSIVIKMEKQSDTFFRARGEFVGRWPVTRVLRTMAEIPVNDVPLCDQLEFFALAKAQVCSGADIASNPADDNRGKACDAVSTTIRFEGGSAKFGKIFKPEQPTPVCQGFVPTCD